MVKKELSTKHIIKSSDAAKTDPHPGMAYVNRHQFFNIKLTDCSNPCLITITYIDDF